MDWTQIQNSTASLLLRGVFRLLLLILILILTGRLRLRLRIVPAHFDKLRLVNHRQPGFAGFFTEDEGLLSKQVWLSFIQGFCGRIFSSCSEHFAEVLFVLYGHAKLLRLLQF